MASSDINGSKPRQLLNTVSVKLGCNCRRPKLISSIFSPKPCKSKLLPKYQTQYQYMNPLSFYTSSSCTQNINPSSSLFEYPSIISSSKLQDIDGQYPYYFYYDGFGRQAAGAKTLAVEKESKDPYLDFRRSMLQMIVENEIHSKEELKELLNCFLHLNSPCLHGIIIRVFTDIWNSFFFTTPTPPHTHTHGLIRPTYSHRRTRHGNHNNNVNHRSRVKRPKSYQV
ncbi:hypothetical protein Dimus_006956 [Dionaea muscipula]